MSTRVFLAVMVALGVVALLGFGLISNDSAGVEIGDPAPDRPLDRLQGEGTREIADFRGDWVLVNLWASWCEPCRQEAPDIQAYWERHRDDGFVVFGIDTEDATEKAIEFVEEFGLTYPIVRDPEGERREAFATLGFPESFLVDPDGNIALIRRGPVDIDYLRQNVTPLLRGETATAAQEGGA